jgi:hypothetical protein
MSISEEKYRASGRQSKIISDDLHAPALRLDLTTVRSPYSARNASTGLTATVRLDGM